MLGAATSIWVGLLARLGRARVGCSASGSEMVKSGGGRPGRDGEKVGLAVQHNTTRG